MRFWVVRFIREDAACDDCSSPDRVIVAGGDEVRGGRVRGHAADRAVVVAEHAVLHALHQVIDLALLVRTTAYSVPINIIVITICTKSLEILLKSGLPNDFPHGQVRQG